ncbi:MAG: hypothetical protein O7H40_07665 [Gammaproteobacteria bacterium]|nr:hypothetical protein [Gammaproteobacteria bacterium]
MIRKRLTSLSLSIIVSTAVASADENLHAHGVDVSDVDYGGPATELVFRESPAYALIPGVEHDDFDLDVELTAIVDPHAPPESRKLSRAFVGIAFRVQDDPQHFKKLYLRLANGRAENQLQRNHSTQFESLPDHPWHRLRKETPALFESYVDLEEGIWTTVRIEVRRDRAKLFVHGDAQPALVVSGSLLEPSRGKIGLWVGLATKGYFRNLQITPR